MKSQLKKIMICDRFATEALVELKKKSEFEISLFSKDELKNTHALIIRSNFKIDQNLLKEAPLLELIITCTSGFDHIDLEATEKSKITVMYTPDANVVSAAEMTWALLMACTRHVVSGHQEIKAGHWKSEKFLTFELQNKTLGIVGLGRIGQKVNQLAQAFNMKVIAFDPYQDLSVFENNRVQRASYDELLLQSDILTFHVPATNETFHMLNRSCFEKMNEDVILINASRGSVINEDDLIEALQQQKIRCAGLDVYEKEPLKADSKILKCQNVIMTPHLGAYTEEAFLKASMMAAELAVNYFLFNKTENTLPLKNNWGSLSLKERT